MAGKTFRCELSWSVSRSKEWERCARESWFARYASWGWWTEEPRGSRYEAMVHKNLTSLPAFAGDCVHRAIERWFGARRRGRVGSARELYEDARGLFREGWRESQGGGWKSRPNKSVHLFEHHYGVELPKDRTDAVRELLERCATYFAESPDLAPVREAHPDTWLALETLDSFEHDGVKIYAVPDFAYREGQRVFVWDWKTGRPREDDRMQLATYALYACTRWDVRPQDVSLRLAYLGTGEVHATEADDELVEGAARTIEARLEPIRAAHYDPDEEQPNMELFPANPEARRCSMCRFRELCDAAV